MNDEQVEKFKSKMSAILNDATLLDRLSYLKGRWSDEREFENFDEYGNHIDRFLQETFGFKITFIKATKRPFGFVADIDGVKSHVMVKTKGNYVNLAFKYLGRTK